MLQETTITSHSYLFIAAGIMLVIFLLYAFVCNHKVDIDKDEMWRSEFEKHQLKSEDIVHDDTMWYYRGLPTCVAYGGIFDSTCSPNEHYCSGGSTYGNRTQQIFAIAGAIKNGGEHPLCPLIYQGSN